MRLRAAHDFSGAATWGVTPYDQALRPDRPAVNELTPFPPPSHPRTAVVLARGGCKCTRPILGNRKKKTREFRFGRLQTASTHKVRFKVGFKLFVRSMQAFCKLFASLSTLFEGQASTHALRDAGRNLKALFCGPAGALATSMVDGRGVLSGIFAGPSDPPGSSAEGCACCVYMAFSGGNSANPRGSYWLSGLSFTYA